MGFYEEISKYYDSIFPVGVDQLEFLKNSSGIIPKKVLDIACGTGGYSVELAKMGYSITAVDIDAKMVEETRKNAAASRIEINVLQADMLTIKTIIKTKFDTIFCIGNSIVHLGNLEEISKFINNIKTMLETCGKAVFQIINYDRIIEKGITTLPTIKDESVGLSFERIYERDKNSGMILFNTILRVHQEKIENVIALFPLLSTDFLRIIKAAGFNNVEVYGDLKGSTYVADSSYMMVLRIS